MAGLFATAPKEVIEYFDRRGTRVSWRWTDFAPHEHALGFTVARTEGYDVIDTLREAVRKAVVDRVPYETFRDELIPKLKEKSWWGTIRRGGEKVELGSLRRLQTIYWANIRSAHAAGEWARIQQTKDFLPFLQYRRTLSERARPEHLGWVGITLPVDDPWWRTHFPPNGWNCKCRVEQIGEVAAGRAPPDRRIRPRLETDLWRDKTSGRTQRVPKGIDPGWQRNPGVTREVVAAALEREKLGFLSHATRSTAIADHRAGAVFRYVAGNGASLPWPMPPLRERSPELMARARLMTPVASAPDSGPAAPPAGVVQISGEDAAKLQGKHRLSVTDFGVVQVLLDHADARLRDADGKWKLAAEINGRFWLAVIKQTSNNEVLLNSLHRITRGQYAALVARAKRDISG
ncbi:MAG TPA: phage minor head protein [Beijerinckiaceae bacterium]|nr:phage minor head protein [Beijerinckiaceae bacterium]